MNLSQISRLILTIVLALVFEEYCGAGAKSANNEFISILARGDQETHSTTGGGQQPLGIDLETVRVVPYGTIYFSAFSNSGSTNNTDAPLFVVSSARQLERERAAHQVRSEHPGVQR
jgi:hypothetical protein